MSVFLATAQPTTSKSRRWLLFGAATFGIICPKPLYLALLVYVAVVGSMAYGALVLGAYGLGLAASIGLGGFILLRAGRAARFSAWLPTRRGSTWFKGSSSRWSVSLPWPFGGFATRPRRPDRRCGGCESASMTLPVRMRG
jgi:hypothetical protein